MIINEKIPFESSPSSDHLTEEYPPVLRLRDKFKITKNGKTYTIVLPEKAGVKLTMPSHQTLLGSGGSGEIYAAKDEELNRYVAIKCFVPRYQLQLFELGATTIQNISDEFIQEMQTLSQIKHRNIVRLFDKGQFKASLLPKRTKYIGDTVNYLVVDLLKGVRLKDYIKIKFHKPEDILKVLIQICNAIDYLHSSKQYLHSDIKYQNVLVEIYTVDATLIDFALTRNLNFNEVKENQKITFITDWNRFPNLPEKHTLRRMMETRKALISRKKLKEIAFPWMDIYQFGDLLKRFIDDGLFASFPPYHISHLKSISDRCIAFTDEEWRYNSVEHVRYDIQKLFPDYEAPHRIKALSKIIRGDEVIQLASSQHGVNFDADRIQYLIDSSQFQRLRNVNQLDLCYLIFPGAKHDRFLHSLYTYHLMGEFLLELTSDTNMKLIMHPKFIDMALVSALLHDIFHFPFLHVFQEIGSADYHNVIKTEDFINMFIGQTDYVIGKNIIELINDIFDFSYHDILDIIHLETEDIKNPEKHLIASFLNSGVDIDKLSYLYYDSFFTGVPDGLALDLNVLIRSSAIKPSPLPHVCWSKKGVGPLEQTILARYNMFRKVYWHKANRSIIAAVKHIVMNLIKDGYMDFITYVKNTAWLGTMQAVEYLDNLYKMCYERRESPLSCIMMSQRKFFKEIYLLQYGNIHTEYLSKLLYRLYSADDNKITQLTRAISDVLSKELRVSLNHGDIIIDTPGRYIEKIGDVYIQISKDDYSQLTSLSEPVRQLEDNWNNHIKAFRVFIHPDYCDIATNNKERIEYIIGEVLKENI